MAVQCACPQIHQKKRKIIKHVACRDRLVEFDRIEQDRPIFDQGDVAQVKIPMTAANLTLIFSLRKQWHKIRQCLSHSVAKTSNSFLRENLGGCFEGDEGLLDQALQCLAG